ncbi:MAG: YdbL family protein [Desulfobacteraceae bacterium]|nr:DUF1318 domain-containing protein [Desulfobacteraceae bacterium]MBC2756472.1 YdbL family protein [Desulfobacteraceae bacterium]
MKKIFIFFILTGLAGCTLADVKVEMLSERTALENQVLGSYNSLDAQMLLAASVRGVDTSGNITRPPEHSREYKDTINAMQIIDFHADDLDTFKHLGWVGENNQGLVEPFSINRTDVPDELKSFADTYSAEEFEFVILKINESREKIMLRVIYMNEDLSESDLTEVRKIFAKINAENANPGDKIQDAEGNWLTKKEAS